MDQTKLIIGKYLNGEIKVLPPATKEYVHQFVTSSWTFTWVWLAVLLVSLVAIPTITLYVNRSIKASKSNNDYDDWESHFVAALSLCGIGVVAIFSVMGVLICLSSALSPLGSIIGK